MFTAFLVGWLGILHCYGMCGGIAGAMTMSLAAEIRNHRLRLAGFTLLYGLGRITSYTLAGAISGSAGQLIGHMVKPTLLIHALRTIAGVLVVIIGIYVAGWLPRLGRIERLGDPLWHRILPWIKSLLPVQTPLQAWRIGIFWGLLPCGLVYSMLMVAALTGSILDGALQMFAFGLGTLPGLWIGSFVTGRLTYRPHIPWLQPAAGLLLIASGIITIWSNIMFQSQPSACSTTKQYICVITPNSATKPNCDGKTKVQ